MDRLERYEEIELLYERQDWDRALTVIADSIRGADTSYKDHTVYECAEFVLDNATPDNLDLTTEFGWACKRLLHHFNIK